MVCDLDGVVWLAHQPLPGAVAAIGQLSDSGIRTLFVTNNSFSTMAEQLAALASIGVDATGNVVTSAMAAASVVEPGQRVLVCGGRGLWEAVAAREAHPVFAHDESDVDDSGDFDAVVVGLYRELSYASLARAQHAIRRGARLIGSNEDPVYPHRDRVLPGGGSVLAAVATASGATPFVTGKPHSTMADLVLKMIAPYTQGDIVMVGDRWESDGAFALQLGCRFVLVQSDATAIGRDLMSIARSPTPDCMGEFPSLASVVDVILS